MAAYVIPWKYKKAKAEISEETARIISAAANRIKAKNRERNYYKMYPKTDDIFKSDWIVPNLRLFL